jgi:hypothetical protein
VRQVALRPCAEQLLQLRHGLEAGHNVHGSGIHALNGNVPGRDDTVEGEGREDRDDRVRARDCRVASVDELARVGVLTPCRHDHEADASRAGKAAPHLSRWPGKGGE